MEQKAWELLKFIFTNTFEYTDPFGSSINFADPTKPDRVYLYGKWAQAITTSFEKELEINFLTSKNYATQNDFLIDRFSIIDHQWEQNKREIENLLDEKKANKGKLPPKKELVIGLLNAQNNALFGLQFHIRANKLYKRFLKSESFYLESKLESRIKPLELFTSSFLFLGDETQLKKIHKALHKNFLLGSFPLFQGIFNGKDCKKLKDQIKWIDRPLRNTSATTNAATLFDFLYILKERKLLNDDDFQVGKQASNNFYRRIEYCFSDANGDKLKHLKVKNGFKFIGATPRSIELKTIIKSALS
jgi:hypothetical protein